MAELIRTEGVPIYVQIRESLRTEITGGTLKRGEQLPSENELAAFWPNLSFESNEGKVFIDRLLDYLSTATAVAPGSNVMTAHDDSMRFLHGR